MKMNLEFMGILPAVQIDSELLRELAGNAKCDFCQKTYNDILDYKIELMNHLEKELEAIEGKEQKAKTFYGFTAEKFAFLKKLDKKIKNMDINKFIEQKKKLVSKEPQLQVIYNFLKRNEYSVFNPKILPLKNNKRIMVKDIKEVIEAYFLKIDKSKNINYTKEVIKKFKNQLEAFDIRIEAYSRSALLAKILNKRNNNNEYTNEEIIEVMSRCGKIAGDSIHICPFCLEIMRDSNEEH